MKYILDTNFLIGYLRKKEKFISKFEEIYTQSLSISVITVIEIYAGCKEHEKNITEELLSSLIIIPVRGQLAKEAGKIIYSFARKGKTLDIADTIIGTTAKLHHLTLITQNVKDFPMLYPSEIEEFPK